MSVEEKQAELDALQAAFDEYITSSRELEEELEEELNKCQDDLSKSESRNAVLSDQLKNVAPQLNSMESKLSQVNSQLQTERRLRIAAENTSEDNETKVRYLEGSLQSVRSSELKKVKEENEELCERLAFVEGEVEDYRNELNTVRERHRCEIEEMRGDMDVMKQKMNAQETATSDSDANSCVSEHRDADDGKTPDPPTPANGDTVEKATSDEQDEYIKTLEAELEIVTEQLIETEKKLSQTEQELEEALEEAAFLPNVANGSTETDSSHHKVEELECEIKKLKEENGQLRLLRGELELAIEELALSKEEIDAYEEDRVTQLSEFEAERRLHKAQLDELKDSVQSLKSLQDKSKNEVESLRAEAEALEMALQNSKSDNEALEKDLIDMKSAFDETANRGKIDSEGQQRAVEELLATRSREVHELKEEVRNLTQTNDSLTKMKQHELEEQRNEIASIRSSLQEKIAIVEQELCRAEEELELTKVRLAEAEEGRSRHTPAATGHHMENDAENHLAGVASFEEECSRLSDQNRMSISIKNHLEDEIRQLRKQLMAATSPSKVAPDKDDDELAAESSIEEALKSLDAGKIESAVRNMAKKIDALKTHNAQLLQRILQLQGNIQVCARIRPMSDEESQRGFHEVAQSLGETEVGCFDERTQQWKSYAFDKVWGPETSNRDVFQDVEPLALSVIEGYNACIFAYGQTGSGKTFTMEGDEVQQGISQRTIKKIFTLLEEKSIRHLSQQHPDRFEYIVKIGMLEIYNDEVYDLLDPSFVAASSGSPRKKPLDVRQSADNTVEVPGLRQEHVCSVDEVLKALDRGNANRATASTNLNEHSSRSHMILHVDITSGVGETKCRGSLYLIDLAGSERVRKSEVEGQALKEAQHINKSLSALGNVMEALDRKASHVPYRDSKLTHLLTNSLGGNSRTMMIMTACPHNESYDETTFALKFATRVRRINLGSAQRNILSKNLEETVKQLNQEKSQLSKAKERSDAQLFSLKKEKERIEDKLSRASLARANSKDEMRTLGVLRQANTDATARWQKEKNAREEKSAELGKLQEEYQKSQRELRNVKRGLESLSKKSEDKDDEIFKLKKDLRAMKEQLSEEKIRHRRSQVMKSRIPTPSSRIRSASPNVGKPPSAAKASNLARPASRSSRGGVTDSGVSNSPIGDPNKVSRIRFRVLKILQEHDPSKVPKLDSLMLQFGKVEQCTCSV